MEKDARKKPREIAPQTSATCFCKDKWDFPGNSTLFGFFGVKKKKKKAESLMGQGVRYQFVILRQLGVEERWLRVDVVVVDVAQRGDEDELRAGTVGKKREKPPGD